MQPLWIVLIPRFRNKSIRSVEASAIRECSGCRSLSAPFGIPILLLHVQCQLSGFYGEVDRNGNLIDFECTSFIVFILIVVTIMANEEYSPYAVAESEQPTWRPGEELAASAFLGMVFLYFIDINISIIRVFKRKKGLYFWSLLLGTWGCVINAIGVICKYLVPNSSYLYGFYTICMMGGWTVFAPMQLMVLYSRLHLVNDSPRIQRCVLIVILSTLLTAVLPTWIVVWY